MKSSSEKSLRCQVEKWLAPGPALPVRVIEFGRTRWSGGRYVYVATADGARALFFFRHDDGAWSVCPPASARTSSVRTRGPVQQTGGLRPESSLHPRTG
ncbi:hypothetical protein [Paraburkholderia acidiphila]|uniref:hypothetical protein n=1 Tax=Paraburkholderia acidiphila TaxID=2571747 RepID=UPI001E381E47|nr:hypothetical protein [Paraburkholderia acidiphila]